LDLLGGSEFHLRQGGPRPLVRATWRAPSEMGPQERKKKNAARLGGIFETQQKNSALAELQGLGADSAKHLVISSPFA